MKISLSTLYVISTIAIVSILTYDYIFRRNFETEYLANGGYCVGKVLSAEVFGRASGHTLIYEYNVGSKTFHGANIAPGDFNEVDKFINNKYLVIYLKKL